MNIKYTFIGNIATKTIISDFPPKSDSSKDSKQIFDRLCKNNKKFDDRNKLAASGGTYYFIISTNNLFYLVLADNNFPERLVWELIKNLETENIHTMVNDKGELTIDGVNLLEQTIAKFQKVSSLQSAQNNVDELKIDMHKTVQKVLEDREGIEQLDAQALKIKEGALEFQENANELKKVTWCQNFKYTIIIVAIVVVVLLAIILPIVIR